MNRYITTTLPYVNGDPHLGFALEILQADVLSRAWRARGDEVFFNTGTDEHGQKIWEKAEQNGEDVHAYVDRYAAEFRKLTEALNLDNPSFVRTTDANHIAAAQEIWNRCNANGDIYEKSYTGMYCVGCEAFKTERELDESGHCILHPNLELQEISERNYFFSFSRYQQFLKEYLSHPESVVPEWRREEALNFVESGLEDFSISREKARLPWGVPVPGDESQVMYVWFDALPSYISTLGFPHDSHGLFEKFWQNGHTLQMAGKDQVRFQSLMWQAMLKSAGIKNTDQVFYHGFINSGGQRMSKSLGNVISPYELIAKYGTDATRYMVLRHVHPMDDSDVTWERLDEWYTAHLVNGLGNLVARVMKLAETHLDAPVEIGSAGSLTREQSQQLDAFQFNHVLDSVWAKLAVLDETITNTRPFEVVKENPEEGKKQIAALVQQLHPIAAALQIFMPHTSRVILEAIRENRKPENLFPRLTP